MEKALTIALFVVLGLIAIMIIIGVSTDILSPGASGFLDYLGRLTPF